MDLKRVEFRRSIPELSSALDLVDFPRNPEKHHSAAAADFPARKVEKKRRLLTSEVEVNLVRTCEIELAIDLAEDARGAIRELAFELIDVLEVPPHEEPFQKLPILRP